MGRGLIRWDICRRRISRRRIGTIHRFSDGLCGYCLRRENFVPVGNQGAPQDTRQADQRDRDLRAMTFVLAAHLMLNVSVRCLIVAARRSIVDFSWPKHSRRLYLLMDRRLL